jgi:hypothetical protein
VWVLCQPFLRIWRSSVPAAQVMPAALIGRSDTIILITDIAFRACRRLLWVAVVSDGFTSFNTLSHSHLELFTLSRRYGEPHGGWILQQTAFFKTACTSVVCCQQ